MQPDKMNKLLELISDLVSEDTGDWRTKKDTLLRQCDATERTALEEFVSWFDFDTSDDSSDDEDSK